MERSEAPLTVLGFVVAVEDLADALAVTGGLGEVAGRSSRSRRAPAAP